MSLTKEDYTKLFLPSRRELWVIVALTLVIFLVFEFNLIYLKIVQGSIFSDPRLQESFDQQITAVFGQNGLANIISLVIFWSGVGLVSYIIIWSVYSFFAEARHEARVQGEYVNRASKKEFAHRSIVQVGILAGIVVLSLLSLNITAPYFIALWTGGILSIPSDVLTGIIQIIAGFIGMAINLYAFKVLIDWVKIVE